MGDNADWNDENTKIVCELFAEQVRAKNRSGTHLNRIGYKNLIEKFKEKTGLCYTKLQMKNKWDKLRRDYTNWKRLAKESGLGWDRAKQTYTATDAWWKNANKEHKGTAIFKDRALQNEEELTIMFEDIRNTGDDHWAPSSGLIPESPDGNNGNEDEENPGDEDTDCEDVTPPSAKGKRRGPAAKKDKGKKPKSSGGHWMQEHMGKIMELSERTTTSCESLAKREDKSGCSIQEVMELVKECGAAPGTKEHFIASQVFIKKAEREMFMTLDTPTDRFNWLSMKHDWITRNDILK